MRRSLSLVLTALLMTAIPSLALLAGTEEPVPEMPANQVTLAAVGDLNFADGLGQSILKNGPDYPWRGTSQVLGLAAVRLGNLEVPLSLKGSIYTPKTWTLHADPRAVGALVNGGFNVVALANNHIMDFGPTALQETLEVLKAQGIAYSGAGPNLAAARTPAILEVNGLRLAFLSYSVTYPEEFYAKTNRPGTAPGWEAYLRVDVPAAKKQADLVIVSFHWSAELLNYPKDYQRHLGRLCIDLGAGLVVGHHPHVLQGLEVYHQGLIAYSLGNFAFGSLSAKAKDSIILLVDLDQRGLLKAYLYPVNVNNYEVAFQTQLRTGAGAARVLADLRQFSAAFGTKIESDGDRGVIKIRPQEEINQDD